MQIDVLCVCDSVVSCPLKHVYMCVSVDQLYGQQWMGGCHVMIHAVSVDAHLFNSNHFVRESSMYAGSKPHIVIVTHVLLFPLICYHPS